MISSTNENTKRCADCGGFFDPTNSSFSLNVAISSLKESGEISKPLLLKLSSLMDASTNIKWCLCNSEIKYDLLPIAEETLLHIDSGYNQHTSSNISEIKLDFTSDSNMIYVKNGNFDDALFYRFLKNTKHELEFNETFSFDFISYEKFSEPTFSQVYKKYFLSPNFLLIDEIDQLSGKDSVSDTTTLKHLVSIIKERVSNNKKTFIMLRNPLVKTLLTWDQKFWTKDENLFSEFSSLLSNCFLEKMMSIQETNGTIKINSSFAPKIKKSTDKKVAPMPAGQKATFDA